MEPQLQTRQYGSFRLGLHFDKVGDRFAHRLSWFNDQTAIDLLTSVEGSTEDWPPSPPLQDLHVQELDDGMAVMSVGMAGSGHWSFSCQVQDDVNLIEESAEKSESNTSNIGSRFFFDVACRVSGIGRMVSTYQLGSDWYVSGPRELALKTDHGIVTLSAGKETQLSIDESNGKVLAVLLPDAVVNQEAVKNGAVPPMPASSKKQTFRWQYAISFHPSA